MLSSSKSIFGSTFGGIFTQTYVFLHNKLSVKKWLMTEQ